ncbi:hypothetical protein HAX54_031153 [Datura stramonium]|uniref:Uncharacterized protein n=1 Tax=Datura stramonium TaxID=4076 RepID=A0ABS8VBL5_DATST|nr:hypothetical protein [Datura stramonium]
MATAPVKSQPLHYFSLPQLKWGNKSHTNANHRFRRRESPPSTGDNPPQTTDLDGGSDSDKLPPRSATDPNGVSSSPCSSEKQPQEKRREDEHEQEVEEEEEEEGEAGRQEEKVSCEEGEVKLWNLRPRRGVTKPGLEVETGSLKNVEIRVESSNHMQRSQRLRDNADGHGLGSGKKGKRKLWISLSKEEIEEDVYSMTGSRPARRPKKRSKTIQKQLDNAFPGLYLVGLTADSFRVNDTTK